MMNTPCTTDPIDFDLTAYIEANFEQTNPHMTKLIAELMADLEQPTER